MFGSIASSSQSSPPPSSSNGKPTKKRVRFEDELEEGELRGNRDKRVKIEPKALDNNNSDDDDNKAPETSTIDSKKQATTGRRRKVGTQQANKGADKLLKLASKSRAEDAKLEREIKELDRTDKIGDKFDIDEHLEVMGDLYKRAEDLESALTSLISWSKYWETSSEMEREGRSASLDHAFISRTSNTASTEPVSRNTPETERYKCCPMADRYVAGVNTDLAPNEDGDNNNDATPFSTTFQDSEAHMLSALWHVREALKTSAVSPAPLRNRGAGVVKQESKPKADSPNSSQHFKASGQVMQYKMVVETLPRLLNAMSSYTRKADNFRKSASKCVKAANERSKNIQDSLETWEVWKQRWVTEMYRHHDPCLSGGMTRVTLNAQCEVSQFYKERAHAMKNIQTLKRQYLDKLEAVRKRKGGMTDKNAERHSSSLEELNLESDHLALQLKESVLGRLENELPFEALTNIDQSEERGHGGSNGPVANFQRSRIPLTISGGETCLELSNAYAEHQNVPRDRNIVNPNTSTTSSMLLKGTLSVTPETEDIRAKGNLRQIYWTSKTSGRPFSSSPSSKSNRK